MCVNLDLNLKALLHAFRIFTFCLNGFKPLKGEIDCAFFHCCLFGASSHRDVFAFWEVDSVSG